MKNILESVNKVYLKSSYVKINYNKLKEFANKLNTKETKHYLCNNPFGIDKLSVGDFIQLLLTYHAVGFCYWQTPKWEVTIESITYDGAYAMLGILTNRFKLRTDLISEEEFINLIKSENEIPLLQERINNIKKLSDNFYDEIKNLTTDTELFNYIINKFDFFNDVSIYKNEKIYFYKLAQLLTSDILQVRNYKENINIDINHIVGCADYKITQVLRNYDVLEFNNELSKLVDNNELSKLVDNMEILEHDNEMEIEIRANTLKAIEFIYQELNQKIPRIVINDLIWIMGQNKDIVKKPYHKTYTNFY